MITYGIALDVGHKRAGKPNQDQAALVLPNLFRRHAPLLLLADGMGGYTGGALASQLVVEAFSAAYRRGWAKGAAEALRLGVAAAHDSIKKRAAADQSLALMGSTVVAAALLPGQVVVINVGDSRAYRFRGSEIQQLSLDHSVVAEQVRLGIITPAEALKHPKRNQITQSVVAHRDVLAPYESETDLQDGDIILLCSDGVWGVVGEELVRNVATNLPPQDAANQLVKLANAGGGPDNISVVIARIGKFAPAPHAATDQTQP